MSENKKRRDDHLAHFGVKGMRWGVRKEEETSGRKSSKESEPSPRNARAKKYEPPSRKSPSDHKTGAASLTEGEAAALRKAGYLKALDAQKTAAKNISPEQSAAMVAANEKKFAAKMNPSTKDSDSSSRKKADGADEELKVGGKKKLTPDQIALIAGGAAFIGAAGYFYWASQKTGKVANAGPVNPLAGHGPRVKAVNALPGLSNLKAKPGEPISPNEFMKRVAKSKDVQWGNGGFITKESFERPAFSLPAGTVFHRLSYVAENSFSSGGTYMTHSDDDWRRYLFGFGLLEKGGVDGKQHITSVAKKPINVPDLTTTLDVVKAAHKKHFNTEIDDARALQWYEGRSGGSWSPDGVTKDFIKELKSRGYSAIIDHMDVNVIGDSPLVVFADSDHFTPKRSSLLTNDHLKEAGEKLLELTNRRTKK